MYILPNATDFNNACASVDRTVATKCEIYDDITETNVGSVATFETGVAKPLSSLKVELLPIQDLSHGDPSPTNVCPISGWSQVKAVRSGKNLLDCNDATGGGTGTSLTKSSGTINIKNTSSYRYASFDFYRSGGVVASGKLPTQQVIWSFDVSGTLTTTWLAGLRAVNGNTFSTTYRISFDTAGHYSLAFDLSALTEPMYLSASRTGNSTADIDVTFSNMQIELGSTATAYEPYNGNTNTVSLGGTVYGGTLDVVSGKLTVDRVMVTLDGSQNVTTMNNGTSNWYYQVSISDSIDQSEPTLSNMYQSNQITNGNTLLGIWRTSTGAIRIRTNDQMTSADYKTWLGSNNVQVLSTLATPTVINLTPQQINTIIGKNNIWVDGNNIVQITYYGAEASMNGDGINGEIISMEWDNIVCSNDGLQIGTTCMDEFKMTYRPVSTTMSLMGKEIHPYVGLEFGTPATVTYVPIGVFWVTNAETNDDGYTVNITAYDGMQKLLGNFDATALGVTFPINAWALLTAIATYFDLTVSYDKLTYELLTSDNYTLTTSNGDTLVVQQDINANQQAPLNKPLEGTYRDYVGWIVGLVGANAHMGRNGDLRVGRYEDHGFVIGRNVQHMGGAKINYGGSVTYECIISGTDEEPLQPTGHSGNSITYTNPYITQNELDILNDAIFADGDMTVTPCDVAWRSNPCVDAGDIVSVEDKNGNNSLTYVMERVIRITGGLAEELHCYAETEVVHTLNKSPLVTKFAQLTNDIKEAVNPIEATKGTFRFIDNGDGTNGGFTIYENGNNSWLRCTAGGLGISADGGLTYANAITKNGVVASKLNVLYQGNPVLRAYIDGQGDPNLRFYHPATQKEVFSIWTDDDASSPKTYMTMKDPSTGAQILRFFANPNYGGMGNTDKSSFVFSNADGEEAFSINTQKALTAGYSTNTYIYANEPENSSNNFRIYMEKGGNNDFGLYHDVNGSSIERIIFRVASDGTPTLRWAGSSLTLKTVTISGTTIHYLGY